MKHLEYLARAKAIVDRKVHELEENGYDRYKSEIKTKRDFHQRYRYAYKYLRLSA